MLSSPSVCVCVDGRHWEGLIGTFVWLSTAISRALMVLYMSLLALFLLSCHVCFRRAFVARGRHSTDIVHLAQQGTKTKALRSAVVGQGFERKGKGEFKWFGFCRSSQPQLRVWEFKKVQMKEWICWRKAIHPVRAVKKNILAILDSSSSYSASWPTKKNTYRVERKIFCPA